MNMRSFSLFALDTITGGRLRRHLNDLQKEFEEGHDENVQASKLSLLLKHSASTVSFYKKYDSAPLWDFPVIDKNIIRRQSAGFLSKNYSEQKLYQAITSGSTGTPFVTYQDQNKRFRNSADAISFGELAGFRLGESLYYFKIWSDLNKKTRWQQWRQNIYPIDVLHLNDDSISTWIRVLRQNRLPRHILGYSSALEEIARYLARRDIVMRDLGVRSIISMSEALNEYTKSVLSERFGVMPCSRYSNLENGIIAQQTPDSGGGFLINTSSYCVEILDLERDIPADPGKLGRIVVTDLYNYAMPLIRYDTGDLGSIWKVKFGEIYRMFFDTIKGRKLDVLFDSKGELISSYLVYKNMWRYPEIDQYQLIQEDEKVYHFKINVSNRFCRERELIEEFLSYLGRDATFEIEYVDEIPLLDSGKRRKVINNYLERLSKR